MGICNSDNHSSELSPMIREKALLIFNAIDVDKKGTIDRETTQKYWQSNFAKLNTDALFKAVDFDNSGDISMQEWLAFWKIVKKTGYSESEISDELDQLLEKKAWAQFKNVDQFIKNDKQRRRSQISSMVQFEKQKTIHKSKTQEYS